MQVGVRRGLLALPLAIAALPAGCGHEPPPDAATSRAMVARTVLDWHRFQAAADGGAGCALLTDKARAGLMKQSRKTAEIVGATPPSSCQQVVAGYARMGDRFRELMRNTQVDAVRVDGERATATAHTSAVINGVLRQVPPAELHLRWEDGAWRMD